MTADDRALVDRFLDMMSAEAGASRNTIAAYRNGSAPHPRLPFADWETCASTLDRAGRVIVAGCRDAGATCAHGLVPSHNSTTALAMAAGLEGEEAGTGVVLGPPYPAIVVGGRQS